MNESLHTLLKWNGGYLIVSLIVTIYRLVIIIEIKSVYILYNSLDKKILCLIIKVSECMQAECSDLDVSKRNNTLNKAALRLKLRCKHLFDIKKTDILSKRINYKTYFKYTSNQSAKLTIYLSRSFHIPCPAPALIISWQGMFTSFSFAMNRSDCDKGTRVSASPCTIRVGASSGVTK